jgi:hypothetical protein
LTTPLKTWVSPRSRWRSRPIPTPDFAGTAHRVGDARELRQHFVAGGLGGAAVLLADLRVRPPRGAHNPKPIDAHYHAIRVAMQGVFHELGLAA